jgi:HAD superfamily hydrolase (TIGR01509 family)
MHGHTNDEILKYFISEDLTDAQISELSLTKEANYRDLCLQNPDNLILTTGLIDVLDHLKAKKVPMTIATAGIKENVDFYFDVFDLGRWFDYSKVVYDDGSFPGKPQPDIFLKAAANLALPPQECLVIEDAFSGILAANRAGIGTVLAIDPTGQNREKFAASDLHINQIISDFTEFPEVV